MDGKQKRAAASVALLSVLGLTNAVPVAASDAGPPDEELGDPIVLPAPTIGAQMTRQERIAAFAAYQSSDYAYGDAIVLADYWGASSPHQAKLKAGALMLEGYDLPFESRASAFSAYIQSDLTWADSLALAEYWGTESSYESKIKAGFWLLAGYDPLEPLQPPSAEELALGAFFDTGYDYDDAVALAEYWGLEVPYDAKIKAGSIIVEGGELPEDITDLEPPATRGEPALGDPVAGPVAS